jgi:hypothetical protein
MILTDVAGAIGSAKPVKNSDHAKSGSKKDKNSATAKQKHDESLAHGAT